MIKFKLFSWFLFVTLLSSTQSELFTAMVDLERLLYTEGEIVRTLDKYLAIEEQRLEKVRWFQEQFNKLHKQANEDVENFLSNPVNAYLLVKRLTADWKEAELLIQGLDSKALIENITHHRLAFPDEEDLSGAAEALMRLQDTYKLDTTSLAKGLIEGANATSELTADDCYELGLQAYYSGDYYHTILWMQEALDRVDDEKNGENKRAMILEHMAYARYMQGNIRQALKLTEYLLTLVPDHERASDNIRHYKIFLADLETRKRGDDGSVPDDVEGSSSFEIESKAFSEKYSRLCRGEIPSTKHTHALRCQYFTNDNPFLLLQPVREEELCLSPRIVIYHNILSDKEMDVVKTLAQPMLRRATVQNSTTGDLVPTHYRISKSAWLVEYMHPTIAQINRRIQAVTGLAMETAEDLQVVNYGIGGHYDPHFDFAQKFEKNAFKHLGTGNRIATWLNYMSDVIAGGATVFTEIDVHVKPEKGSAAFWFNLHKNGEGDERTKHAACPVLAGSKWVSNKWFHAFGNEFTFKCGLQEFD